LQSNPNLLLGKAIRDAKIYIKKHHYWVENGYQCNTVSEDSKWEMSDFKLKHEANNVLDNRHSFRKEGTRMQNQENITQVKGKAIPVTCCRGP
jgi:hypothetical protein